MVLDFTRVARAFARCDSVRRCCCSRTAFVAVLVIAAASFGSARAQVPSQTAVLLDKLCAQTLRTNEEDRLFGLISTAVRSTIKYRGGTFVPDLIDDAVQDSLDTMIESCPRISAADASQRLSIAVAIISDATTKLLGEARNPDGNPYSARDMARVTAADLSEELSSQEIDTWLNSLPPRQRVVALFLYASDVTPREIAAAVGEPPGALVRESAASKADLLRFFRQEWEAIPLGGNSGPAMQYREAGPTLTGLLKSTPEPVAQPIAARAAAPPPEEMVDGEPMPRGASIYTTMPALTSSMRVTGISDDLYAGWSLLATITNLPRGQRVSIPEPFLLEPDGNGVKRVLVVDIAEIGDPYAVTRRFLLKAYAIDAQHDAAGLRDSFHLGTATIDNEEAKKTLANANLSSIEVARCLWFDYKTGEDPGLCR
jgi:DNA-directed RNA polymerase specialized sigma24 family protein